MTKPDEVDLEALRLSMEDAANRGDFETAAALRDRISLLRGASAGTRSADFDPSGLERQTPGAMGLGTSQQRVSPPAGWTRPKKPDPMTTGRSRRGGRRKGAT
ncbi:UvrB/UvrC motif-containing protein [Sphingobium sp. CR2-8]|uniref:UvrB/UvrC motif-containing protein n=1 Tax=Sphingobium sp. CR2-8 TaxID=1306534 RepID=UPI002DB63827|nr:UvrB/UvrC motif-containing protein [Sphingobium sp. CR2-8]MEC3909189.1 UvrB/UvrC motif-containing protein [Sphingobium sp. CR2-8]